MNIKYSVNVFFNEIIIQRGIFSLLPGCFPLPQKYDDLMLTKIMGTQTFIIR